MPLGPALWGRHVQGLQEGAGWGGGSDAEEVATQAAGFMVRDLVFFFYYMKCILNKKLSMEFPFLK